MQNTFVRARPMFLVPWLLGLVVFPFYVFGSGSAQPSTFLFLIAMTMAVFGFQRSTALPLPILGTTLLVALAAFVSYTLFVAISWAALLSDTRLLMPPVYYGFNLTIVAAMLLMYRALGDHLVYASRWAIFASVLVQFVLSFFLPSGGYRESLFFNNPNQLGYFGLVCASILALPFPYRRSEFQDAAFSAGILMCLWLSILSLSKSATLSIFVFFVISGTRSKWQLMVGGALLLAVAVFNVDVLSNARLVNLESRYATFGSNDDSLDARGYERLWDHPEMLILGGGEGAYERWGGWFDGEIHSSIGTIVFSYGIVGLGLFLIFVFTIVRAGGWWVLLFLIPELVYSLTHMSLRFVMTWVYLTMLFLVASSVYQQRRANSQVAAHSGYR